eukprot:762056-Hanusia_phi.AAC.1
MLPATASTAPQAPRLLVISMTRFATSSSAVQMTWSAPSASSSSFCSHLRTVLMVCSKLVSQGKQAGLLGRARHLVSLELRDLHELLPEGRASGALKDVRLRGVRLAEPQALHHTDSSDGVHDRLSRVLVRHTLGNLHHVPAAHQHILRPAPCSRRHFLEHVRHHPVTDLEVHSSLLPHLRHSWSHPHNLSSALKPGNARQAAGLEAWVHAHDGGDVGGVDGHDGHADEDFLSSGGGDFDLLDRQPRQQVLGIKAPDHDSLHLPGWRAVAAILSRGEPTVRLHHDQEEDEGQSGRERRGGGGGRHGVNAS